MRKKLIFFTIAVLIMTVTIMGALVYYYVKNFLINVLKNEMDYQASLSIEYLKASNLKDFDLIAKNIKSDINKRVTIIKKDGTVLGDSDVDSKVLENHKDRKEFIEALNKGIGISFRKSFTLDKMMFYYAKKFLLNGDILVMRISMELDLVKIMQEKILYFLFITIFISLSLSSGLLWFFLNKFVEPIKELIKIATIISMGEYDKRIRIKTNDEIGQLGHAFNIMAARLEETILDLEDKKNKLISILKSMDDGVIVFDNNQNIILVNPAARKMFDIKEDVTGKHLIEVVKNLDLEDLIKENIEEEVELKISFPDVKYLKIRTTKVYNNDKANEDLGTLMVIQDVTKMKMLENMRSDFVANVSHELKTPLTSIKGFAETLKDVEDEKIRRKFLDIINIEAERLTKLINDILTLSELENKDYAINFEKLNVIELIEEVIYIMNPLAKNKNITIDFENNCNEIIIYGDRDKFKQMMINLIDNAIKYTNEGGKVLLKALKLDRQVEIYVIDNGIGISKEHLPRLFERFYRVDKARSRSLGGTGLGLAIVKHIVNLMKGKIDVYSEVGEGTTFKITFPL